MNNSKKRRIGDYQRSELFERELNEVLKKLGIAFSKEFNLILHNDKNFILHVVVSLSEVCNLSNEMSFRVMMEAHTNGRAIAYNGNLDELHYMRIGLESRGLTVTLEHAK